MESLSQNDKPELERGYMFRSSRRLVYYLCCENICKLKMLFVFGLRSFHNLVETSWLQRWIFWYLDLLWRIYGYFKVLRIDNFTFQICEFQCFRAFLLSSLIIYYPNGAFIHQNPRNRIMRHYPPLRVSLINDVHQGKTCAHDSYQHFIQWLSLIFLLWNKNFLTKFLNSIISLDLKSAVNWSTFDIQTSLFAFITSSIKWQTLIWCDLSANPLVVDIFSEELSTKIYDIFTIFARGPY